MCLLILSFLIRVFNRFLSKPARVYKEALLITSNSFGVFDIFFSRT